MDPPRNTRFVDTTCSQVYLHYNRATRFDITMPSTNSVNELLVMQRTVHKTGTDLRHMYKHETLLQKKKGNHFSHFTRGTNKFL